MSPLFETKVLFNVLNFFVTDLLLKSSIIPTTKRSTERSLPTLTISSIDAEGPDAIFLSDKISDTNSLSATKNFLV